MTVDSRREFLRRSSVVLGTVAAGSVAMVNPSPVRGAGMPTGRIDPVVGFGWEITNLDNNGADVYFEVESAMTLNSVNIDVAFSPTSTSPTGNVSVLCAAYASRGGVPTFNNTGGHAYVTNPASSNFGSVTLYNPNGLSVSYNSSLAQDQLYAVSLKTWVPSTGSAAATSRQVLANPSLSLSVGDYVVFHIDHEGVPGDAEMQVVLEYSLA